jgi:hypothetical protein
MGKSGVAVLTFGYNPNAEGPAGTSSGCLGLNFNPVAGSTDGVANNPFSYGLPSSAYLWRNRVYL